MAGGGFGDTALGGAPGGALNFAGGAVPPPDPDATSTLAAVDSIRNIFPETWLWTNSSVGYILFV